ncbi:MAG TPA: cation transporter [Polyangiaceae bacterium]|nr:cation transporter [Polyangiaceae bacterium]
MRSAIAARLLGGLLAVLGVSACSRPEPPPAETFAQNEEAADSPAVAATITVEGMVCQSCANAAAEAASNLPGVVSAEGDFEAGTLSVRYLPETTDPSAIAAAITAVDRGDAPAFSARVAESP